MRKLLLVLLVLSFSAPAGAVEKETITVRELGEAVHYLIDLYQQTSREVKELKKENEELKKKLTELEKKFVLLKMEQNLSRAQERGQTPEREMKDDRKTPVVEIVPGNTPNPYPWITFKRSDVECSLPERNQRGFVYYNVLVTRSKEKAINVARNVARTGLCTVVRKISKEKPLYRVVVIPDKGGVWKKKLKELNLSYVPYVRDLDLTRSSGGEL